jgi:hypothetical protein
LQEKEKEMSTENIQEKEKGFTAIGKVFIWVVSILGAIAGILSFIMANKGFVQIVFVFFCGVLLSSAITAAVVNRQRRKSDDVEHPDCSEDDLKLLRYIKINGIIGVYKDSALGHQIISGKLDEKINTLRIIAYQGNALITNLGQKIEIAIKAGTQVQILIASGGSPMLREVKELENIDPENSITQVVLEHIAEILKNTKDTSGSIAVKQYNTQARAAIVIVDDKWAWWTPYFTGVKVEETTSIELENSGKDSIIKDCITHFDLIWKKIPEKAANSGSL